MLIIAFSAFNQDDKKSHINYHYILNPCSDNQFFEDVYSSIDSVKRIFVSNCFYYNELLKHEKVFVDTFDMLIPSNYFLLESIYNKHGKSNVFGYQNSSYTFLYFKTLVDSIRLKEMNDILNDANFKKSNLQYFIDKKELKNLHAMAYVELEDSLLVRDFLSYLPDSVLENRTLNMIHRSMYLGQKLYLDTIFTDVNSNGNDLIVDFNSYDESDLYFNLIDLFHKVRMNLWFYPRNHKVQYHIAINGCDGVKKSKIKRLVRREFNLRRRDLKCGNIIKLPNDDEVKFYCY